MKERMEALKKTKIDLAEFFCEDGNVFKLDECYKSLASFCSKFKQAVTENVKRKAQEDLQENRRAQRELEEQKKSKSGRPTITNLLIIAHSKVNRKKVDMLGLET